MAALLRKFARGGLTVDEFESDGRALTERDPYLAEVYTFAWYFYDDFRTETLTGEWRLSAENRRLWAKWVLFLMTRTEDYEGPSMAPGLWPMAAHLAYRGVAVGLMYVAPVVGIPMLIGALLGVPNAVHRWVDSRSVRKQEPVADHWPFASKESFENAIRLSNPFAVS